MIRTPLVLGPHRWQIEVTLTARDNMLFVCCLDARRWSIAMSSIPPRPLLLGKRK